MISAGARPPSGAPASHASQPSDGNGFAIPLPGRAESAISSR